MMKIAEVIATFPPYHGGMGYVCYHNALELARRGHDVTVFTLEHGRSSYDSDPGEFKIVRLRTPVMYGDGGIVPQLYTRLKGFDIIHLHYPFFGGAEYVYLATLLCGRKYFLTYHMDVYGNTLLKKLLIGAYSKLFMKRIIQKAEMLGALSREHLKSSQAARFVDWSKVVDMPNGVDTDIFSPREKNEALLDKHGLRDKVVVLFVGNLQPFKGLHILIDAMAMVKDERIVLLIVGGGYCETNYRMQVKEKGLQERVLFAGPQSIDENLPLYYNLCDFLVLPSTYSESFGLVVLEAMASGKPAIVSSLPGPSHLIDHGKDGLIVKTGDREDLKIKIEYLGINTVIRQGMGMAAREKVLKKYRWDAIGAHLEKTLKKIAQT
jgi:glycosyltransferase involved in cell wall biosynthesis